MAVPTIWFMRRLDGRPPELLTLTVGAVAVKQGDPCMVGATQDVVIPMTAREDVVVGVATHDAIVGAEVNLIRVDGATVFRIGTGTHVYTAATCQYDHCDMNDFTSGAMHAEPLLDAANPTFLMLDLYPGSPDATAGSPFQGIFLNRMFV